MANNILWVDGKWYKVFIPKEGIKRSVSILDGSNAGRTKAGNLTFDTLGTYYNYTIDVIRNDASGDYDELHKVLRDPQNRKHMISVPFDQGFATYEAYVANIDDILPLSIDGKHYWDKMSIKFVAVEPNEVPR